GFYKVIPRRTHETNWRVRIETLWRIIRLMDYMGEAAHSRARLAAAWLCLLAALALYAPLGAAAWLAHGMACWAGDHCPIKEHHHPKKQLAPRAQGGCGHEMGEMVSCSMACCDDSERSVVTPVAFVLPDDRLASVPLFVVSQIDSPHQVAIFRNV